LKFASLLSIGLLCAALPGFARYSAAAPAPSSGGPSVWACGESLKVSPTLAPQARNSVWDASAGQVRLFAGRQEYVAFQVIVRAPQKALSNVEVRIPALRSASGQELAASNIDLFWQHYMRVKAPSQFDNATPVPEAAAGEYPVQMVPLREGKPGVQFSVPAGRNQPVWVDLYVPEDQAPGDYTGQAQVLVGGQPVSTFDIQLTVWNFQLPRETHYKTYVANRAARLRWAFGIPDGRTGDLYQIEDRFVQMAHQHRLNFHPYSEDVIQDWGGRYRGYLDGTAFKERAGQGAGQNLLVVPAFGDSQSEVGANVRDIMNWWKSERFPASLACYLYDEPSEKAQYDEVRQRSKWIRSAVGDELPLFLTCNKPQNLPADVADLWGEVPASDISKWKARGTKFWATNEGYAGGPYVDTPGYAGRSQAWMGWKMKLDAWQFWASCYWLDDQNTFDSKGKKVSWAELNANPRKYLTDTWNNPLTFDQKRNPHTNDWIRLNGDGVLFYPGTPVGLREPLASFTMKSLRRGLQDYEYLWMLRQLGQRVDDVVDSVTPAPYKWARDPETWDRARLELGRRLHRAVGGGG